MFFRTSGRTFRFGHFELDTLTRELRKDGSRVPLARQPFAVLAYLVTHPQQVVTRTELQQHIWGPTTTVNVESGLHSCMTKVRWALGWEDGAGRFIETLEGEGYRFVPPVETIGPWRGVDAAARWLRKRQDQIRKRWQRLKMR